MALLDSEKALPYPSDSSNADSTGIRVSSTSPQALALNFSIADPAIRSIWGVLADYGRYQAPAVVIPLIMRGLYYDYLAPWPFEEHGGSWLEGWKSHLSVGALMLCTQLLLQGLIGKRSSGVGPWGGEESREDERPTRHR